MRYRFSISPGDWVQVERALNLLSRAILTQGLTASSTPEFAGITLDALDGILKGNSGAVNVASAGTDYEVPLTFSDSLARATNDVTLDNDSNAPGNNKYYGTDGTGVKGFFDVTSGAGLTHSIVQGSANQVLVSANSNSIGGSADVTLSLPQDIATTSSPTFATVNLTSQALIKGDTGSLWVRNTLDNAYADLHAATWYIGSNELYINATNLHKSTSADFLIDITAGTSGGSISLVAGGSNGGSGASGGNINLTAGAKTEGTGTSGNVNITSGDSIVPTIDSGNINILSSSNTTTNSGTINLVTGNAPNNTGAIAITTGTSGADYSGNITLTTGFAINSGSIIFAITPGDSVSGQIYCNGQTRIQSLTGLLKGTSGVVSAAAAGADYDNYWTRTGSILTPRTDLDDISTDGTFSTVYTLGADKITNGNFTASDAGWTYDAVDWTWVAGYMDKDQAGSGTLYQSSASMATPLVIGEFYILMFTISDWTGSGATNTVTPSCGGGTTFYTVSTAGTFSVKFQATSTANLVFTPGSTSRFHIYGITLKKAGGNVTLAGQIVDTMTANGWQSFIVDGITNPWVYSAALPNFTVNSMSRTFTGASSVALPTYGTFFRRILNWDYDFTGTTGDVGGRAIYLGEDLFTYSGDITINAGLSASASEFIGSSNTFAHTGAYTSSKSATAIKFMGVKYASYTNGAYTVTAGTSNVQVIGAKFTTLGSNPTVSLSGAGALNLNYAGGYFEGTAPDNSATANTIYGGLFVGFMGASGSIPAFPTAVDGRVIGGYFAATGGATNYGIYSVTATAYNVLVGNTRIGGPANPTVALDVTGAILNTTTIEAGTGFKCGGTAAVADGNYAISATLGGTVSIKGGIVTAWTPAA